MPTGRQDTDVPDVTYIVKNKNTFYLRNVFFVIGFFV